jgi:hypothetical protein
MLFTYDDDLRQSVAKAIQAVRAKIHWKPQKDLQHLKRRIDFEHLPPDSTITDYESIISQVLHSETASVQVFRRNDDVYPTITAEYRGKVWLVMFGLSGIMETAFPPDDPEMYLADKRFEYLGEISEFLI